MVNITGPDDVNYSVDVLRAKYLEDLLLECGYRYAVFEGNFPWVRKTLTGYKTKLKTGWESFPCPVRGGFIAEQGIFIHIGLTSHQKVAILFHDLAHIKYHHPEGEDLGLEKQATAAAISLVEKSASILIKNKFNPSEIINELKKRTQVYGKLRK